MSKDDTHGDHGFQHDLPKLLGRRAALGLLGGFAASASAQAACVLDAPETRGPYPADGSGMLGPFSKNVLNKSGVIRRDLRSSFAGRTGTAAGTAFELEMQLVDVAAGCAPLADRPIYLWHCDAIGAYSLYDLKDQNYLRGVAVTDAQGIARVTTIYPGCYPIRWPHIHYEVFESVDRMAKGRDSSLIGQLALPEAASRKVYEADAAYKSGLQNLGRNSIPGDFEFRDDSAAQTAQRLITVSGSGPLKGRVTIGV